MARKTAELADFFRILTGLGNSKTSRRCVSIFKAIVDKIGSKSLLLFGKLLTGVRNDNQTWLQTLLSAEDYQLAFEGHTFLAGLCLSHPSEVIMKPILEAITMTSNNENVRFRLASYFFVLLWRCDLGHIRKLMTKVEDAAVYLGPDNSEAVKDMLSIALMTLKSRDLGLYRKCIKLMRKSVVDRIEQTEKDYELVLLEKLKEINFDLLNHFGSAKDDGRPHGKGADFKIIQICPLVPKEIEAFLDNVAGEVAQEELMMSARYTNLFSSQLDDDTCHNQGDCGSPADKNDRINPAYQRETKEKFKRYKSNGKNAPTITEYTEESLTSRANPLRSTTKKSSKTQKKVRGDSETHRDESKLKSAEDGQYTNRVTDFKVTSPYYGADGDRQHISEPSRIPPCLVSPKEQSMIKIDTAPVIKVTRFGDEEAAYHGNIREKESRRNKYTSASVKDNEDILNDEIKLILEGKGTVIPSKREPTNQQLYNETVIKIVEDIIFGSEKDDVIKLHAYFSAIFHREPNRMMILDNILDMCMYYLAFEHGPFKVHTKLVLQVICEYLRGL